ncbi:MAG: hypothetical protein JWR15_2307 [Prosthecobacter sp.]|nr:hypothetical protein [Prosthecobacter sp.]
MNPRPPRRGPLCLFASLIAAGGLEGHGIDSSARRLFDSPAGGWQTEPWLALSLIVPLILYAIGTLRLWKRMRLSRGVNPTRLPCFLSGWLILVLALMSPLHPLGNELFYAHMIQHELLMIVAAPLLVLGRPLVPMMWGMPHALRQGLARCFRSRVWDTITTWLVQPLVAWMAHALILWLWHLPSWFEAALHNDFVHALQHVAFLGSALIFWQSIVHSRRGALSYGAAVLFLFTTALHSGLLGALLALAGSPWYRSYLATSPAWGLSPLEDQQLGGLIMWIPAGLVYLVAALAFFAAWLQMSERRNREN